MRKTSSHLDYVIIQIRKLKRQKLFINKLSFKLFSLTIKETQKTNATQNVTINCVVQFTLLAHFNKKIKLNMSKILNISKIFDKRVLV